MASDGCETGGGLVIGPSGAWRCLRPGLLVAIARHARSFAKAAALRWDQGGVNILQWQVIGRRVVGLQHPQGTRHVRDKRAAKPKDDALRQRFQRRRARVGLDRRLPAKGLLLASSSRPDQAPTRSMFGWAAPGLKSAAFWYILAETSWTFNRWVSGARRSQMFSALTRCPRFSLSNAPHETILAALHVRLSALPATALRGAVLPERIPAAGQLIWPSTVPQA